MEDPIESRLRELMRAETNQSTPVEDHRLDRVLHKAHMHAGVFDLINLFARWGWVLSEGGSRALKHSRPVSRRSTHESLSVSPESKEMN
ncbi:hypothetical protein [Halopseudomonas pelagia]|uniref:hypothetical protein n=1 Tax=Halopseudomonas pelagia TaxID=553151 RepID=UPI0003A1E591|nr:hypothetical protein [Halopseudomonas pelagia]